MRMVIIHRKLPPKRTWTKFQISVYCFLVYSPDLSLPCRQHNMHSFRRFISYFNSKSVPHQPFPPILLPKLVHLISGNHKNRIGYSPTLSSRYARGPSNIGTNYTILFVLFVIFCSELLYLHLYPSFCLS